MTAVRSTGSLDINAEETAQALAEKKAAFKAAASAQAFKIEQLRECRTAEERLAKLNAEIATKQKELKELSAAVAAKKAELKAMKIAPKQKTLPAATKPQSVSRHSFLRRQSESPDQEWQLVDEESSAEASASKSNSLSVMPAKSTLA